MKPRRNLDRALVDVLAAMMVLPEYKEINRRSVERAVEELDAQGIHVSR